MDCVPGLAIGTASTIGNLVAMPDRVLAQALRPFTLHSPQLGSAGEDPEEWWFNVQDDIPEHIARDGIAPKLIRGCGVPGMPPARVAFERTGEIIRYSIHQCCGRNGAEADEIARELGEAMPHDVSRSAAAATGRPAGLPFAGGAAEHMASGFAASITQADDLLLKFGGAADTLIATREAHPDLRVFLDHHVAAVLSMPNGCTASGGSAPNWYTERLANGERAAAEEAWVNIDQHLDQFSESIPPVTDVLQAPVQPFDWHPGSRLGTAWVGTIAAGVTDDGNGVSHFVGYGDRSDPASEQAVFYDAGCHRCRATYEARHGGDQ